MSAAIKIAAPDLGALRDAEYLWTRETTYLNAASIGPIPERTRRAIDEFNRRRATPHLLPDPILFAILARSRELAAQLINADVGEIALATNTSFGVNLAARALPLEPGDIVLASEREFPANVYPWQQLKDQGVVLELAPTTVEGWPDEDYLVERVADPKVRVLAVSLVQFGNGYTVDLDRLSRVTRATGTYLAVDAIQGLGQVPVDVRRTPVDILASGAQKWLLSPWGSGFVYVRKELIRELEPKMVGWTAFEGSEDYGRLTRYSDTLRPDARRFEVITLPFQDFAGMNESLAMLLDVGVERIAAHLRAVQEPVRDWAVRRGVRLTSPTDAHGSAIIGIPAVDDRMFAALRGAGIVCGMREGSIRLSPHLYNTVDDLARAAALLDVR